MLRRMVVTLAFTVALLALATPSSAQSPYPGGNVAEVQSDGSERGDDTAVLGAVIERPVVAGDSADRGAVAGVGIGRGAVGGLAVTGGDIVQLAIIGVGLVAGGVVVVRRTRRQRATTAA